MKDANGVNMAAMAFLPFVNVSNEREPHAVEDATGVWWESPAQALYVGLCDFCGCGWSDGIADDFVRALHALRERWHTMEDAKGRATPLPEEWNDYYGELILQVLGRAGLAEHGGSVGGSWLTPVGLAWANAVVVIGDDKS